MNYSIFFFFNNLSHQSIQVDWLIVFLAGTFGYILIFIAFVYLLFYIDGFFNLKNLSYKYNFKERFWKIAFVLSSTILAWGVSAIIKEIVASSRPFSVFENMKPLFLHGGLDSFPSGHATFFGALAVSLFFLNKKVGVYFMIGALLIGLARITAGVHFPIDIMAGIFIGIFVPLIINYIYKHKNR